MSEANQIIRSTVDAGRLAQAEREIARLRAVNEVLVAALETISEGDTMRSIAEYTLADVLQKHYQIARAALAKAKA